MEGRLKEQDVVKHAFIAMITITGTLRKQKKITVSVPLKGTKSHFFSKSSYHY